jgi:predicted nucleic acid-binding protein
LILVDSSVWIEFFSAHSGAGTQELRRIIAETVPFSLTGISVSEILQGLTRDVAKIEEYLGQCERLEPRSLATFTEAATIYRVGRSKGISLTTIDSLIAAIALDYDAHVFTLDKDFTRIARFTRLRLHEPSRE